MVNGVDLEIKFGFWNMRSVYTYLSDEIIKILGKVHIFNFYEISSLKNESRPIQKEAQVLINIGPIL